MANRTPEVVAKYEVLFAVRTGVTILMPKIKALDGSPAISASFRVSSDSPRDIVIDAGGHTAIIRDLQKDYLEEAVERGFIMFYETQDDEVVRCTPCGYQK